MHSEKSDTRALHNKYKIQKRWEKLTKCSQWEFCEVTNIKLHPAASLVPAKVDVMQKKLE